MNSLSRFIFFRTILCSITIFFLSSLLAEAQSTLEYAALATSVAAATNAKKEKTQVQDQEASQASSEGTPGLTTGTMTKIYSETNQAMSSKVGALLGQVGGYPLPKQSNPTPTQTITTVSEKSRTNEPENKNQATTNPTQDKNSQNSRSDSSVKIYLKNRHVIQGKMIEQKDDSIKIDLEGTPVTFFKEEIDRIEKIS